MGFCCPSLLRFSFNWCFDHIGPKLTCVFVRNLQVRNKKVKKALKNTKTLKSFQSMRGVKLTIVNSAIMQCKIENSLYIALCYHALL